MKRSHLISLALLPVAALSCFWGGLSGEFLFDDFPNLAHDDRWKPADLSPQALWQALTAGISSASGRPLAMLSFALNYLAAGMEPSGYKLTNVLWHSINGALVWLLTRHLFAASTTSEDQKSGLAAFLIALAWLLHPLQVSTTLYVIQRMEIGAATGVLLCLLAYLRARANQQEGRTSAAWWGLSGLALLFGLGFKESAALAPAYALAIELAVLRFRTAGTHLSRSFVTVYAAGVAVAIAGFVWFAAQQFGSPETPREFSSGERLLTQGPVLAMYFKQTLFPVPGMLWFHYDNFPISRGLLAPPATAWSFALLIALFTAAVVVARRWPLSTLGILWFFAGHALTSNIIPLELAFEHRNYLPLFGLIIATVQPLRALGTRLNADARRVLVLLPVLALGALCAVQAATWGDPLRLAWTLENVNPTSQRASYGLGEQLIAASHGDTQSPGWSMGRTQMAKAASLPGPSPLPLQGLILLDAQSGRPVPAEHWTRLQTLLTRKPLSVEGTTSLHAIVACEIKRRCEWDPAPLSQVIAAVVERNPRAPDLLTIAANRSWNVLGDRTGAVELQRRAIAVSDQPEFVYALVQFLLASEEQQLQQEGITRARALLVQGRLSSVEAAHLETLVPD